MQFGAELSVRSINGDFDLKQIREFLLKFDYIIEDPTREDAFILNSTESGMKDCLEQFNKPDGKPPVTRYIGIHEKIIVICMFVTEDILLQIKTFLEWLVPQYECKIRDDYGTDFTEIIKEKGVGALFEEALSK